jgi:NADH-quinone oxidoreductase subunit M
LQAINWLQSGFVLWVSCCRRFYCINHYNLGENISFINWITQPNISFALKSRRIINGDAFVDHSFDSIIIFSSFGMTIKFKIIYALILFMSFAMAGTFLASDGLLYIFSGN